MDDVTLHHALLPAGLRDLLPPEAATEAASVEALVAVFSAHGYQRVRPPLLEFEETLLAGSGAAVGDQIFRVMDPDSHRMMGLRADITPQIARIAATRLAASPRPLRLSYAGQCVRVRGGQIETGRQVKQVGIELIGADGAEADAEVMVLGAEALAAIGLDRISIDLTLPTLAPTLLDAAGLAGKPRSLLVHALDRKDAAAVAAHGGALAPMLGELLRAAGPAGPALAALAAADLPETLRAQATRLTEIVAILGDRAPGVKLTIDPVEFRGFRYHTGIGITFYAACAREELARGGRYLSGDGETATGLTLYADAVLRAAPKPAASRTLFVPLGANRAAAREAREAGFVLVAGLVETADTEAEARRMGCTHVLRHGTATALGD